MNTGDVKELLEMVFERTEVENVAVRYRPRLLSDNGFCNISGKLQQYLEIKGMTHTRDILYYPMTQGKIGRYQRSRKNIITFQNYYLPCELEQKISRFNEY